MEDTYWVSPFAGSNASILGEMGGRKAHRENKDTVLKVLPSTVFIMRMTEIKNLNALLKGMNPVAISGEFVFCAVSEERLHTLNIAPTLVFREKEGVTLVIQKKGAEENNLLFQGTWALITLNVYSSLSAVGLLAIITKKLAQAKIPVNIVSAYYHDHIFVPYDKAVGALKILKRISASKIRVY